MENSYEYRYKRAKEHVNEIKGFYTHAMVYALVISALALLNYNTTTFPWVLFPALGWGIGLLGHGLSTFGYPFILGKDWEERKIKEFMERNE